MGQINHSKRPTITCGKSRTQQHLAELSSPKKLIERYGSKRLKEALSLIPTMYSDIPPTEDLKEALDMINQAQMAFNALPSGLRNRFENDPVKLHEFLNDANNKDEAVELGLIERPAVTDEAERKDVKKAVNSSANKDDKTANK